ncbi:MAG: ankyrin repeat domain-containing protein [Elusimicrobiales bacterium]|nr:ankyrin repeat domain-containing protein [Elusimicrobiales bacterium]
MSIENLIKAAENNDKETVRSLINSGVNINIKYEPYGFTPLHIACFKGHLEIVKLLLENGAAINAKDEKNPTPLHVASIQGHTKIAKLLIENKADMGDKASYNLTHLKSTCEKNKAGPENFLHSDSSDINNQKGTPLYMACIEGNLEIVKLLIEKGSYIETKGENNNTLLHIACNCGYLGIVKLLIEKGININAKDNNNITPLLNASNHGHTEIVKLLLSKGADANIKGIHNTTPLHVASAGGYLEIVKLLTAKGADINARSDSGLTGLDAAYNGEHLEVTSFLSSKGGKRGKFCFVATVVYGSPDTPELEILRNWRDETLSYTWLGKKFINSYYKLGPFAAKIVSKTPILKSIVRVFLDKMVKWISCKQKVI